MVTFCPSLTLNHTCLKVKDGKKSVEFYQRNFGMTHFQTFKYPEQKFTIYLLSFDYPSNQGYNRPLGEKEAVLELIHHWGSEQDETFKYNNGNVEPHRGFGHICFSVDNINACCEALASNNVIFKKKLSDGRQKDIAFALDLDGYWIELIKNKAIDPIEGQTEFCNYKFNHTMIRVKDPLKSLKFYQEVLGMKLVRKSDFPEAKFTLYFLGYEDHLSSKGKLPSDRQGLLELTHNWGTELDPSFSYHNGNTKPTGYGHIGLSLKDAATFCREIEDEFPEVEWIMKYDSWTVKNIGFLKDPDGYWIEIFPYDIELKVCPACSGELSM